MAGSAIAKIGVKQQSAAMIVPMTPVNNNLSFMG
jgi:hypothetical protein